MWGYAYENAEGIKNLRRQDAVQKHEVKTADVHDDNERLGKEAENAHHEAKHVLAPGLRKRVSKQTKAADSKRGAMVC
jgi:hypothetical protein